MNIDVLLGKTTEHLAPLEGTQCFVHKQMLHDFLLLQKAAREAGFDLQVISGFRDYERQLKIWNAKARGERPLFDDQGNALDYSRLLPQEVMWAILRWSALPGASRHHWGTDIDVFDQKTQRPADVKLLMSECEGEGPAARLHDWLDSVFSEKRSFGFYRPYNTDRGGVAPEKWHLSYYHLARRMIGVYTHSIFRKNIEESDLLLKDEVLERSAEIYQRYLINVDMP